MATQSSRQHLDHHSQRRAIDRTAHRDATTLKFDLNRSGLGRSWLLHFGIVRLNHDPSG
jgi:hypothetical protein